MNKPEGLDLAGQTFAGEVTLLKYWINHIYKPAKRIVKIAVLANQAASETKTLLNLSLGDIFIGLCALGAVQVTQDNCCCIINASKQENAVIFTGLLWTL
jgi:hypothetical protein